MKGRLAGAGPILLLFAVFVLPPLGPGFAWMSFVVPAAVMLALSGGQGNWPQVLLATAAGFAAAAATGAPEAGLPGAAMLPAAAVMSAAARKRTPLVRSALETFMAMALAVLLLGAAGSLAAGKNFYTLAIGNIRAGIDASLEMIKQAGELTPEQVSGVTRTAITAKRLLPQLFPGMVLAALAGATLLNLALGRLILGLTGPEETSPWPPFSRWRAPEPLVFGVIIAGFALLSPYSALVAPAAALLMLLNVVYFYQGLAVLTYLFESWRTPPGLRLVIILLLALQAYGVIFLSLTGLIDVWADLRARMDKMLERRKQT